LYEQRDRLLVADRRGGLDMVRDRACGSEGASQRQCRARVGPDLPGLRHVVVDGPADDRVAEPKSAWGIRGADEVGFEEFVKRRERRPRVQLSDCAHQLWLERLTSDSRRL